MKNAAVIIVFAVALLQPGCATQTLWDNTSPRVRVFIPYDQVTEEQLQARHVDYIRCNDEVWNGYLVKKDQLRKFRDMALRVFGTPVTLAIDATTTVVIVGAYVCAEAGVSGTGPF